MTILTASRACLKALFLYLSLSRSDGGSRVRVIKTTALLAVLELSALGGADANSAGVDLGAACTATVRIGDTSAGGELLALAVPDVLCTGIVGSQGKSGDGDCHVMREVNTCVCSGMASSQCGLGGLELTSHNGGESDANHVGW